VFAGMLPSFTNAVAMHACPGRPALRGLGYVQHCGSARAFIPPARAGKALAVGYQPQSRAVAPSFRLPPTSLKNESQRRSFIHV
jgi:hypothetical protein